MSYQKVIAMKVLKLLFRSLMVMTLWLAVRNLEVIGLALILPFCFGVKVPSVPYFVTLFVVGLLSGISTAFWTAYKAGKHFERGEER